MTATACFWLVLVAAVSAVVWYRERQRAADIRQVASKLGFIQRGRLVPGSLNLNGTGLERMSSSWNVMEGKCGGTRIVLFDCRIGEGKGSWRRTVVAAEGNCKLFEEVPFVLDLAREQSGEWTILYRPKSYRLIPLGLMPASEMASLLQLFGCPQEHPDSL